MAPAAMNMHEEREARRNISQFVTVFVATVGDQANFDDCLAHLDQQTVTFRLEIVSQVAPMSAAFQAMLDRCTTEYYVQVDEDMILFPDAIERLFDAIREMPPKVCLVCGALWDRDINGPIYGIKIYRHGIVRHFAYEDTMSCEKTQMARLQEAGYPAVFLPFQGKDRCLGEHGCHYSPQTLFVRWQRLFQKQRQYGTMAWVEPWAERLLERYRKTGDTLHLFAFLGAVVGIAGELPADAEKDFRQSSPEYDRLAQYFGFDDAGGTE